MANESSDYFFENVTFEETTSFDVNETQPVPTSISPGSERSLNYELRLRDEPWAIPLLSLSSINLVAIACFEVYVLYKSCGSRRHLFLGQTLLCGLFLCSVISYAFTVTPHWFICGLTRAGVAIVYALIFATLLTKLLFLIGLHSGIYLNSAFQSLLIFFAVGVQVAVSVQWLFYRPPALVSSDDSFMSKVCRTTPLERVQYLAYPILLIFMTCIAAIRGRSLRENNNEARYIGASIGILVIVWVSWASVFVIFERRYEDPAQGFGLVCTSLIVFMLVFVPKAVQLSLSCKKNGSAMGSQSMVFAPSFLQLQPHSVLPSYTEGNSTLVKNQSAAADFCRGYASRLCRYEYPTFYQMESSGKARNRESE